MTTITLELSPELEAKLRDSFDRNDSETARQLLAEAFAPAVESMLRKPVEQISIEEMDRLLDEVADMIQASYGDEEPPVLSDYALSREGIYEDHP